MNPRLGMLAAVLVVVGLGWHGWTVWDWGWSRAVTVDNGRDFASYHYAVRVAWEGGDPYDKLALGRAARADGTRTAVHPYFYPPPFLLGMVWTLPMSLAASYRAWFVLHLVCVWGAALVLWRWWRPLGSGVGVTVALAVCALTSIPDNLVMGQMNVPVLLLVVAGLWQAGPRGRRWQLVLGGALVGAACMMKMSPALFVAWWVLRREWVPVVAACATALGLTLLSAAVFGPDVVFTFFFGVLPGFSSGDYNGLTVPISLWGNHSFPNIYDALFPGGDGLSATARWLSLGTSVAVVAGLTAAFWRAPTDALARAAQVSAVACAMLLLPAYTYEHHLVWALPAVVITATALLQGRLPAWAWAPVGGAWLVWAFDRATLKSWALASGTPDALSVALREAKFAALLVLFVACVSVGWSSWRRVRGPL